MKVMANVTEHREHEYEEDDILNPFPNCLIISTMQRWTPSIETLNGETYLKFSQDWKEEIQN